MEKAQRMWKFQLAGCHWVPAFCLSQKKRSQLKKNWARLQLRYCISQVGGGTDIQESAPNRGQLRCDILHIAIAERLVDMNWPPAESNQDVIYIAIAVRIRGSTAWISNPNSTSIAICDGVSRPEILDVVFYNLGGSAISQSTKAWVGLFTDEESPTVKTIDSLLKPLGLGNH